MEPGRRKVIQVARVASMTGNVADLFAQRERERFAMQARCQARLATTAPFDSALFALRPRGARFVLFHLPAEYASFSKCGMRF
jgi:hypothetical protein